MVRLFAVTGPDKFAVGFGGKDGLLISSANGLQLTHTTVPCQIRFVQCLGHFGNGQFSLNFRVRLVSTLGNVEHSWEQFVFLDLCVFETLINFVSSVSTL